MSRIVLLDSGLLGLVTNPRVSPKSLVCAEWLQDLLAGGADVLDELAGALRFLPITSTAMRQAAAFWAQARQAGQPTAPDPALDADAILAGQAAAMLADNVVIATTNVGHLSRFVAAAPWHTVQAK